MKFSKLIAFFSLLLKLFKIKSQYIYVRTDARMERGVVKLFSKITKRKYIFALAHDDDAKNIHFVDRPYKNKNWIKYFIRRIDDYITDILCYKSIEADLVVAQTEFQKKYLIDSQNIESIVIPNSYSENFIDKNYKKENYILWVGNMRPFKRPEIFLKIVKLMKDSSYKFLMIGKPNNYKELISTFKQENFIFLGHKSYDDTLEYFKKSKIVINTSKNEGFSNTFFQAWANSVHLITLGVNPDNILTKHNIGKVCLNINEVVQHLLFIEKKGIDNIQLIYAQNLLKDKFSIDRNFKKLVNNINII